MYKYKQLFILAIFLFAHCPVIDSQSTNKVKNIVIFFSYGPNLPGYQIFLEGIHKSLYNYNQPYNLLVEFLDVERIPSEKYAHYLIDQYNEKFKNSRIDLLITVGPGIKPVLIKNGLEALNYSPTINIEIPENPDRFQHFKVDSNILEIMTDFRIEETIKHAFALFPENKEVYVLCGNSRIDNYFEELVKHSITNFNASHYFHFYSGITIDSALEAVKQIPSNAILVVSMFLLDKNNISFSTDEVENIFTNNCKAPVFTLFESFGKNKFGLGGYVYSYSKIGQETGRIAKEILDGKKLNDMIVNYQSFYQHIYDWKELQLWNLQDSKLIPSNSIFYNKEIDFFDKYKKYIIVFFLFLISQSIVIIYLIKLYRKQKELAKQKKENEIIRLKLLREERLLRMAELTASLSHELNQPLTAILYNAQAGLRFLKSGKLDNAQAQEIFEFIVEDDKRAGNLISSVKSLMKIENRENEIININDVVKDTINIFYSEALRNQIQIKFNIRENQVLVLADKIQLQQVILNLIANASIAMETNNPENKIIEIESQLNKDYVTISVRDYGHGIDDEIKPKLFKAFNTTHKSGFGIGLSLSRSIIENHGGEIWGENLPDGGAKFSFKLKVVKDG